MEISPELQKAHNAAKVALMQKPDSAFFITVCFSLKHKWDETIPTACTNGTEICFNPDFFIKLSVEERVFLMLHESMHVAFLHVERFKNLGSVSPQKFNIAADHVINLMLLERGFKMPKGGFADKKFSGLSTEEVVKLLPEPPPNTDCDLREAEGDPETFKQAVQDIIVRASVQSKMENDKVGSIPGEIQIFLNGLLEPKLPWNRILQKYLQTFAKNDYTFKRPNRRFFPQYYLPSLYSQNLMDLAIAIDTSGSVSDEDFKRFVTEITSIMKMMKPEKMTLVQFDTDIKQVDSIKSVRELSKMKFSGRGGTDIRPLMDWVEETKPQLLLVFTDGYFQVRDIKTRTNVLWLIHNNPKFQCSFGKIVHYKME